MDLSIHRRRLAVLTAAMLVSILPAAGSASTPGRSTTDTAKILSEAIPSHVAADVRRLERKYSQDDSLVTSAATPLCEFLLYGYGVSGSLAIGQRTNVKLRQSGVNFTGALTGEFWSNVDGGVRTENWWNTLLDLGVAFDLAKFGGPASGRVFAQVHWVKNRDTDTCFAHYTGALNPVSGTMAGDQVRVFNLYYHQTWRDGTCALKLGQLALDDDFMGSDYAALFANSALGAMPSQVGTSLSSECGYTSAFPIYAVAAPGVWLQLRPRESFSWQTGVYYGGPGPDTKDNHGFDWDRSSHSGVLVFSEIAWSYPAVGRNATLRIGGSYHSGHFENYDAIQTGRTATVSRGLASFYAVHDLMLATDTAGRPKLAVFGRAGLSPQRDRSIVTAYADAGLNWFAPLAGRPDDIAGAAVSCTKFARAFRSVSSTAATETTVELTYKAQLTPRLAMQADAQFLFHPLGNSASGSGGTTTVLGLRAKVAF